MIMGENYGPEAPEQQEVEAIMAMKAEIEQMGGQSYQQFEAESSTGYLRNGMNGKEKIRYARIRTEQGIVDIKFKSSLDRANPGAFNDVELVSV